MLDEWYIAELTPFFCAEILFRGTEDADPHIPVFTDFPYGQTTDGVFNCSTGRVFEAGGTSVETATFAYLASAAEGAPEGGYRPSVYGGLASQSGGAWRWASALPETEIGELFVETAALTVLPEVVSPYSCSGPLVEPVITVERLPECRFQNNLGQGPHEKLGAATSLFETMFANDGNDVRYCVDEKRGVWTPQVVGPHLRQYWSTCWPVAEDIDGISYVLADEGDPQINGGNYRDIVGKISQLSRGLTSLDPDVREAAPHEAGVWVESGTARHELDHIAWNRQLLDAMLGEGLDELVPYADAVAAYEIDWEAVRQLNPNLFQSGLPATLRELTLQESGITDPSMARRFLQEEVERLLSDAAFMLSEASDGTKEPMHVRQYRVEAEEVDRVRSAVLDRFD